MTIQFATGAEIDNNKCYHYTHTTSNGHNRSSSPPLLLSALSRQAMSNASSGCPATAARFASYQCSNEAQLTLLLLSRCTHCWPNSYCADKHNPSQRSR